MTVKNIVVLTGSGISAESGVATFRDPDGVWAKYDVMEVATPEGFAKNPDLVHEFYNKRRTALGSVVPNAAHLALARLEQHLEAGGGKLILVTQNVDDLHERAGSKNIFHMHGELAKIRCVDCQHVSLCEGDIDVSTVCTDCGAVGSMRPDIVWFGEEPFFMEQISDVLLTTDLFVSIGTSGSVYPAAGFVSYANSMNIETMELNLEPSENAHAFSKSEYGPAATIVPNWVEQLAKQVG